MNLAIRFSSSEFIKFLWERVAVLEEQGKPVFKVGYVGHIRFVAIMHAFVAKGIKLSGPINHALRKINARCERFDPLGEHSGLVGEQIFHRQFKRFSERHGGTLSVVGDKLLAATNEVSQRCVWNVIRAIHLFNLWVKAIKPKAGRWQQYVSIDIKWRAATTENRYATVATGGAFAIHLPIANPVLRLGNDIERCVSDSAMRAIMGKDRSV